MPLGDARADAVNAQAAANTAALLLQVEQYLAEEPLLTREEAVSGRDVLIRKLMEEAAWQRGSAWGAGTYQSLETTAQYLRDAYFPHDYTPAKIADEMASLRSEITALSQVDFSLLKSLQSPDASLIAMQYGAVIPQQYAERSISGVDTWAEWREWVASRRAGYEYVLRYVLRSVEIYDPGVVENLIAQIALMDDDLSRIDQRLGQIAALEYRLTLYPGVTVAVSVGGYGIPRPTFDHPGGDAQLVNAAAGANSATILLQTSQYFAMEGLLPREMQVAHREVIKQTIAEEIQWQVAYAWGANAYQALQSLLREVEAKPFPVDVPLEVLPEQLARLGEITSSIQADLFALPKLFPLGPADFDVILRQMDPIDWYMTGATRVFGHEEYVAMLARAWSEPRYWAQWLLETEEALQAIGYHPSSCADILSIFRSGKPTLIAYGDAVRVCLTPRKKKGLFGGLGGIISLVIGISAAVITQQYELLPVIASSIGVSPATAAVITSATVSAVTSSLAQLIDTGTISPAALAIGVASAAVGAGVGAYLVPEAGLLTKAAVNSLTAAGLSAPAQAIMDGRVDVLQVGIAAAGAAAGTLAGGAVASLLEPEAPPLELTATLPEGQAVLAPDVVAPIVTDVYGEMTPMTQLSLTGGMTSEVLTVPVASTPLVLETPALVPTYYVEPVSPLTVETAPPVLPTLVEVSVSELSEAVVFSQEPALAPSATVELASPGVSSVTGSSPADVLTNLAGSVPTLEAAVALPTEPSVVTVAAEMPTTAVSVEPMVGVSPIEVVEAAALSFAPVEAPMEISFVAAEALVLPEVAAVSVEPEPTVFSNGSSFVGEWSALEAPADVVWADWTQEIVSPVPVSAEPVASELTLVPVQESSTVEGAAFLTGGGESMVGQLDFGVETTLVADYVPPVELTPETYDASLWSSWEPEPLIMPPTGDELLYGVDSPAFQEILGRAVVEQQTPGAFTSAASEAEAATSSAWYSDIGKVLGGVAQAGAQAGAQALTRWLLTPEPAQPSVRSSPYQLPTGPRTLAAPAGSTGGVSGGMSQGTMLLLGVGVIAGSVMLLSGARRARARR